MSSSSSTSPFFLGSEDSASRAGEDVEPVDLQAYRKMLTGGSCTANTSTTTCPATSKPPPYACTLCGKIFHKLSTAKIHSLRHQDDAEDTTEGAEDAKTRQRTCTLCGKLFFSQIVMALHTMSEPFFPSCHRCLETFDGADEKKAHLCKEFRHLQASDGKFPVHSCPLGCDSSFVFTSETVYDHLTAMHGCRSEDIQMTDDGVVVVGGDLSLTCSLCGIKLNADELSLEDHVSTFCPGIGKMQRELVKSTNELAEETGLDFKTLLRLEITAYLAASGCDKRVEGENIDMLRDLPRAFKDVTKVSQKDPKLMDRAVSLHREIRRRLRQLDDSALEVSQSSKNWQRASDAQIQTLVSLEDELKLDLISQGATKKLFNAGFTLVQSKDLLEELGNTS